MSDNDDIEVESDVSPGASSFPCGLSGGDSGRGSQRGDGGRGPGRRRLLPLPLSLGARTASVAFPARSPTAPGRSGLLGLEEEQPRFQSAVRLLLSISFLFPFSSIPFWGQREKEIVLLLLIL